MWTGTNIFFILASYLGINGAAFCIFAAEKAFIRLIRSRNREYDQEYDWEPQEREPFRVAAALFGETWFIYKQNVAGAMKFRIIQDLVVFLCTMIVWLPGRGLPGSIVYGFLFLIRLIIPLMIRIALGVLAGHYDMRGAERPSSVMAVSAMFIWPTLNWLLQVYVWMMLPGGIVFVK